MRNILAISALSLGLCAIPALGQSRADVREAQKVLQQKGYYTGQIDGVAGPLTHEATRQYQEKENINADGVLGPKTLDSLGVKHGSAETEFNEAGENVKHSYGNGGKDIGHGTVAAGSDLKHGEVVDSAKDLGKGVGHGVAQIGVGTGHAVKHAAKGATSAVTGDTKQHQ